MIIGILKESTGENRVSLLPEMVKQLVGMHTEVWVEEGAGSGAFADDSNYQEAGATIHAAEGIFSNANLILTIHFPPREKISQIRPDTALLGVYQPLFQLELMQQAAVAGLTVLSLDNIPRNTRAQNMDVLSSQANIAGYRAVLETACRFSRYFPMLMTAAGTIPPARILILGAGVAGLQAIATARRLGGVVEVFDTRPAVKEEVMSLGAKFVEVEGMADPVNAGGYAVEQSLAFQQRQQARIAESIEKADIVITTAQIPGRKAPVLVTAGMIGKMKKGSVILDISSATGGNTELTKDNETVNYHGVTIIGNSNLPSLMPADASRLYGKNILNFLKLIIGQDGNLNLDFKDELVSGTCITHGGVISNDRMKTFFKL
ncbi:MAG TPA: Re/Si-specific NAD(P)(+) transhydrogenase subunit alpha [Chitinophagaceae bacterium]|nr:Re/Si-specific NAD(P)(+) transhydrogenase subunit alpha [Chitinophagaceae bacterium]